MNTEAFDLGNTPTIDPPTLAEQAQVREALGITSVATLTPAQAQGLIYANALTPYPLPIFFDDCDGKYPYSSIGDGAGDIQDFSNAGALSYGLVGATTGATSSNYRVMFARIAGQILGVGTVFQSCFAVLDVANCDFFVGLSWVGTNNQFGIAYRSGQDSSRFVFKDGASYIPLSGSTAAPQNGSFNAGKRYKFTMTQLTATTSTVKIEEADFNLPNWATLHEGSVTHSSRLAGLGNCPTMEVMTKTNSNRAIYADWFSLYNLQYQR